MKTLMLLFCSLLVSWPAFSAQKDELWYKVESPEKKTPEEITEPYQFDSLESKKSKKLWQPTFIWSLRPKLSVGGGFLADKGFLEGSNKDRWFFASDISFRNRAWHRVMAGLLLTQNSNLIVSGAWHYTPSRKWVRAFYGVGAAISLFADSEFRSLIKNDGYFLTASYGWEALLSKKTGFRAELKGYVGLSYYGLQFMASYIWHL